MIRLFAVLIALIFIRCTPDELSLTDLQAFIQDDENGLQKTSELDGTRVEITYKPIDLCVQQEIEEIQPVTNEKIDSLRRSYDGLLYFVLSLSRDNREALDITNGMDEYSDLVQTLSFQMHKYVTLTTASLDTIPVGDFMLNRTYGVNNTTEILFVFNKSKAIGQSWIQFNLNEFGLNVGNQRFRFFMKDLNEVPELKF